MPRNMKKVVSPVERKGGKTYWMRVGNAFANRDGSITVYLDATPGNMKLQIFDFDEEDDRRRREGNRRDGAAGNDNLPPPDDRSGDDLPF
jgi:hypothetical protein